LYSSHEARAAQNAQRMLDTGEWGLPVLFDGQADLQKPPGYYWLVAATGWATGGRIDAFVARFPAAVGGFVAVMIVFGFLRREGRPIAAWVAAVGLATAVHFTAISRIARIDVPLTAAVATALVAFYRGCVPETRQRLAWHLGAAVAAAVAVLLKGPVGLALIGPTAVVFLLVDRGRHAASGRAAYVWVGRMGVQTRNLTPQPPSLERKGEQKPPTLSLFTSNDRFRLPLVSAVLGTLTVLVLTLPWFVWANDTTGGEFVRVFFWHHNVARFAGTSPTLASYPWWYYVPRSLVDFLPWTPALLVLVGWGFRSGLWGRDRLFRFGLIWVGVMFVVLSAAQFKRADYLLPLFPGAAIVLGCAAEAWVTSRNHPRTVWFASWAARATIVAVAIGWLVMTYVIEPAEQVREEKRAFAAAIRSTAPPPHEILMFRAESHLLVFHLGRPVQTLVEWHDLNDWLARPGPRFVVMPPEYLYSAHQIVTSRKLAVVTRLEDHMAGKPPRPLVFVRTTD
jgi:4-amino-4-deoxy-L-arabinose transferase-like glycosyltransferase